MKVQTIEVEIRGKVVQVEVPMGAPEDMPPFVMIGVQIDMLCMALLALEDPRVDAVLAAFGFQIVNEHGDPAIDLSDLSS